MDVIPLGSKVWMLYLRSKVLETAQPELWEKETAENADEAQNSDSDHLEVNIN